MASADKQAVRNREILIAAADGEDAKQIAARYDLSPTRVRQILAAGTAILAGAGDPDPVQVALERRAQYESIYEEAVAMFERIPDSNPSPKVGALRLGLAALDRLTAWDQIIGVTPKNLFHINQEMDMRRIVVTLTQSIEEADMPPELIEKIAEDLDDRTSDR